MSRSESASRLVKVYKSQRKADMFLYVDFSEDLKRVPETLLGQFGTPELAVSLLLNADKKLAQTEARVVLEAIAETGFFLQLPATDGGVDAAIERARKS